MSKNIYDLHSMTLAVSGIVTAIVFAVMFYAFIQERRSRRHSTNNGTAHSRLEIIWTLIPILILLALALPAVKDFLHT